MVMVALKDLLVWFGFEWSLEVLLISWNQYPRHERRLSLCRKRCSKNSFQSFPAFPTPLSLRFAQIQKKRPEAKVGKADEAGKDDVANDP